MRHLEAHLRRAAIVGAPSQSAEEDCQSSSRSAAPIADDAVELAMAQTIVFQDARETREHRERVYTGRCGTGD